MGDPRNLSFSTGSNQPKIIINSSEQVSVPVSAPLVLDTLLTIPTGSRTTPLPPRVVVRYNGIECPAFGSGFDTFTVLGVNVAFFVSYNSANDLVIESYSQEASPVDMTISYRIYKDARPL